MLAHGRRGADEYATAFLGGGLTGSDVLVIEDIRTFKFPAIYARTLAEGERLLFSQPWREVWFDFDLGLVDGSDNVMPLVNELERRAVEGEAHPIDKVIVHSMNPVGRTAVAAVLGRWYEVRMVEASRYLAEGSEHNVWVGDPI